MEMDIVVERAPGKSRRRIILNAPAPESAFMERLACGGIGGFSMGAQVYRADNGAGCGKWRVEDEGVKPGDYF